MADLLFEVKNHVAYITLNRPEAYNAFSGEMVDQWIASLERIRDDDNIRAVIVSGNGKAFCSGGDIKEMAKGNGFYQSEEDIVSTGLARKNSLWKKIQRVPLLLEEIEQPVIAKVHGFAFGAGLDMALMCDIRIVAVSTKLSESYINVGLVPGDGAAYFLPRIIGTDKALDMLWTGKIIDAMTAEKIGLATYVIDDETLDDFTEEYIQKLVDAPQQAVRLMKRAVYQNQNMDLRASLDMISSHMAIVTELPDYEEGVQAVIEKRKPNFNREK